MVKFTKSLSLLMLLTLLTALNLVNAQTIKGKVLDAATGEPLVGAVVKLENTKYKTIVKLDGTYVFVKLPLATYTAKVYYEGYTNSELQTITLTDNSTKSLSFNLKPTVSELSSVTVTATEGNGSDIGARRLEKISDPIINVLSAKTLQLLPDITVANALQRVSGVSIERSGSGEGRYPIIRGMEKRYINTLVNGIKIPSPDNKNRFIPLDLFPSELLERLEVSKSLTPSMEGDAIGGTINLVMKDAPEKKLLQINASTGYSDIFGQQPFEHFDHTVINKKSPNEINGLGYTAQPKDFTLAALNYNKLDNPINTTFGITYGNRFGARKQFGLIAAGSFQNIYKGTNSTFFLPNAQPGLNNVPEFQDLEARKYSFQSKRFGANVKLDYEINGKNKIALVNTFVRLDDYATRLLSDTVALNSLVDDYSRSTWQYQSIYNSTLQGFHKLSTSLKLDWSLVYSIANNHKPDEVELDNQFPIANPTADNVQGITHVWSHNSDKDFAVYLNATDNTKLFGKSLEIKVGGLIRDKNRDNLYHSYSLKPVPGSNGYLLFTGLNNLNDTNFTFKGAGSAAIGPYANNYSFNETVSDGYLQGKIQLTDNLEALGGVRVEYTHQHYETSLDTNTADRSGSIWYTDVLPSLQLKYKINRTQTLRLAYYKALARPSFAEMIPGGPGGYEDFKQVGDPANLKHTTADNIDLRYEVFSDKADQILLGVFYKNINDPIEYAVARAAGSATAQQLQAGNFGTATNYGFEALYTKYIGSFGVSAGYTYTDSKITSPKLLTYRNSAGKITDSVLNETRPMQGQSKHIGNISLLYKNPKIGFDAQIAFVYTGERVTYVNPNYGLDYWQTPTSQIDLSVEKRVVKNLTFYAKLNNLANTPFILQLHQPYNTYISQSGARALPLQTDPANKIVVQKDYYKSTYLFGVRYKF